MKRFLLFSYSDYYPLGGMQDLVESFDLPNEAKAFAKDPENGISENQVLFDTQTGEILDLTDGKKGTFVDGFWRWS